MTTKRSGLGRNLNVLLSNNGFSKKALTSNEQNALSQCDVTKLQPGKFQPRRSMDDDTLQELANSIKKQGVLQPIIVRSIGEGRHEIIAGERRWRAAQIAGLDTVPVIHHEMDDETAIAVALIENIQRENLNPMEESYALSRLVDEFALTHEQVGKAVGKSRAAVSNLLRLMNLNVDVKRLLEHGDIEMGHARALLALNGEQQSNIARLVVSRELSVRETEHLIRRSLKPTMNQMQDDDPMIVQAQTKLNDKFGKNVKLKHGNKGKGKVEFHYQNTTELENLLHQWCGDLAEK